MDLPFKFCKIGLKNTLFIFGRKNSRLLLCVVVCCYLLFVVTLSDFGLLFLKNFKRETFCGQESERGVNSILTTILRF